MMIFFLLFLECESGYFGKGCENMCGWCFNNDVCDYVDGFCLDSCFVGWKGLGCKDGKLLDFWYYIVLLLY